MRLDFSDREAAGIKADDFVVEPVQPGHTFGHQNRIERAGPVARDRKLDLAVTRQNFLRGMAVAAVASGTARRRRTPLIAEMVCQLRAKGAFHQRFLQLAENPALTQQVLRAAHPGQQLIQNFALDRRHRGSHPSPHFPPAIAGMNTPAFDTAWANVSISGSRRCSGMLGMSS